MATASRRRTKPSRRPATAAPSSDAGGVYSIRRTMRVPPADISVKVKLPRCLISPDSETQPISCGRRQRSSRRTLRNVSMVGEIVEGLLRRGADRDRDRQLELGQYVED